MEEQVSDLVEHEPVERVGSDVAFGAAVLLAASADRVVVAAVVIAMPGAVATSHLVAVGAHPTGPATDQPAQQPFARFSAARTPLAVVYRDLAGGLEDLVGNDARNLDEDPLVTGTRHLPVASGCALVGHGFSTVERPM